MLLDTAKTSLQCSHPETPVSHDLGRSWIQDEYFALNIQCQSVSGLNHGVQHLFSVTPSDLVHDVQQLFAEL